MVFSICARLFLLFFYFCCFFITSVVFSQEFSVPNVEKQIENSEKGEINKAIEKYLVGKQRDGLLYERINVRTGLSFGISFGYSGNYFQLANQIVPISGLIAKIKNKEKIKAAGFVLDFSGLSDASSGEKNTNLRGIDTNFVIQYDVPHTPLFLRTGFAYGAIIPIRFNAVGDVLIPGLFSTPIFLDIDLTYGGSQLEVPFLIGLNLLRNSFSNIYIGFGLNWSYLSLKYEYSSRTPLDGYRKGVGEVRYANSEKGYGIGLLIVLGGSIKVYKYLDLFAEFKYFTATANVNITRPDARTFPGVVAALLLPEINTFRSTGALLPYPAGGFNNVDPLGEETSSPNGESYIRDLSYARFNIGLRFHL